MPVWYNRAGMKTMSLPESPSAPVVRYKPKLPTPLRVAIVVAGHSYWRLALIVNAELPPEEQMSERLILLLATDKKRPSRKQAEILSRILRRSIRTLFPE
jgi:hypothetical protein